MEEKEGTERGKRGGAKSRKDSWDKEGDKMGLRWGETGRETEGGGKRETEGERKK